MVLFHYNSDWLLSYPESDLTQPLDTSLIEKVYAAVCRTNFNFPGFCLIDLPACGSSQNLRYFMVLLKRSLQEVHSSDFDLLFTSMGRFDQQISGKFHRDGGADECLLMLGYEPSEIESEVVIADYSKCAYEQGLSPTELLTQANPMFNQGEALLKPYTTVLKDFNHQNFQVLLLNNSQASYPQWQGVLHKVTIFNPSEEHSRIVNSMMITAAPMGTPEPISLLEQEAFVNTTTIFRRGYDKVHLKDES